MLTPSAIRLSICVPVDIAGVILILLGSYGVLIGILFSSFALFRVAIQVCVALEFIPTLLILALSIFRHPFPVRFGLVWALDLSTNAISLGAFVLNSICSDGIALANSWAPGLRARACSCNFDFATPS